METRELYEVLGLQPLADGAMVDQAYWHLAKSFQTLAVTDPRARQALDELNEAYGILGTPRLREEYDETLTGRPKPEQVHDADAKPARVKRGFTFPSLFGRRTRQEPASHAPTLVSQTPKPSKPTAGRRTGSDVQDLQASTGEMLKRWRANAGLEQHTASNTPTAVDGGAPDTTLVDIFRTEREVVDDQDPLNAVMDVLKAAREPATTRPGA